MVLKTSPAVTSTSESWRHPGSSSGHRVPPSMLEIYKFLHSKTERSSRVRVDRIVKVPPREHVRRLSSELEDQFSNLPATANEFHIACPSESLVAEARRVAWKLRNDVPKSCTVYLMPDGAVAVDIRGKRPDGILIILKEDGSAHCSGEIERKAWRKPYPSVQNVPDDALLDELYNLRLKAIN